MPIAEVRISTISEYLAAIEALSGFNPKLWFRGHQSILHTLKPTIYRAPFESKFEEEFQIQFKSRAIPYLKADVGSADYWHWLFLMQHHGVPTRLLDWSSSALIALGFAILYRTAEHVAVEAVVWCLNPLNLNTENRVRVILRNNERIPIVSLKKIESIYKFNPCKYPVNRTTLN
jgi:hypothetical protein